MTDAPDRAPAGAPHAYRWFSTHRVRALAASTFTQLVRMKVFYFLLIFSGAVIASAMVLLDWSFEQELKLLKDVSFGAMQLFAGIFAVVGAAILIPKDIEDRTLYTILSKPVPRFEYLFGKLAGILLLIAVSMVLMQALFTGVLWLRQTAILEQELHRLEVAPPLGMTPDELPAARDQVREMISRQGVSWNLLGASWAIFLKAAVTASVALLVSTFASSTLFTIVVSLAIFVIGHGQAMARDYFLGGHADGAVEGILAGAVAIVFPDFQMFDIVDGVVAGESILPSLLLKITGLAALYVLIYNVLAYLLFSQKEL